MEKLAYKVQDAEAPVEVCKIMVLMAFDKSLICRWLPEEGTILGMPTMVATTMPLVMEINNMAATGQEGLLPPIVGLESRGILK